MGHDLSCYLYLIHNQSRYGKVFKSHIFGSPTNVTADAEVSKAVLQNDGRTFVLFYPKSVIQLMGNSSILLINGSLQKRIHGLIGGFLKSPQLRAQITEDRELCQDYHEELARWSASLHPR